MAATNRNRRYGTPTETTSISTTISLLIAVSPGAISTLPLSRGVTLSPYKSKAILMFLTTAMPNTGCILEFGASGGIDPSGLFLKMPTTFANTTIKPGTDPTSCSRRARNSGSLTPLPSISQYQPFYSDFRERALPRHFRVPVIKNIKNIKKQQVDKRSLPIKRLKNAYFHNYRKGVESRRLLFRNNPTLYLLRSNSFHLKYQT